MIHPAKSIMAALVLTALAPCAMAQEEYFRYQDDEGNIAIDDHVPPRFAKYGYSVIDRNGRVIEVVPRALTDEEKKNADSVAVQQRLREEERARQLKYDENLLRRYSDVADIDAARERRVNEVKVRINMLKANISSLSDQVAQMQQQAADLERDGQAVPEKVEVHLERLREEIASTEVLIEARRREQEKVEARFEYDKQRFNELRPPVPPAPPESTRQL